MARAKNIFQLKSLKSSTEQNNTEGKEEKGT